MCVAPFYRIWQSKMGTIKRINAITPSVLAVYLILDYPLIRVYIFLILWCLFCYTLLRRPSKKNAVVTRKVLRV